MVIEKYKKNNLDKLAEFFHATRIIFDLRKMIDDGKYYQITPIYGQLRALITDRTKERNKEKKPIFEISKILGEEDVMFFYFPDTLKNKLPAPDNIVLYVRNLPITINRISPDQLSITLSDYLNEELVEYRGKKLKVYEIINSLSDKYGGSHYDSSVPEYLNNLMSFGINGQPSLNTIILQIADLFLQLAIRLVKRVSDFELFLTLYIDTISTDKNFIFDYILPNSNCRISLVSEGGHLGLYLSDHFGRSEFLRIEAEVKTKNLILIGISHRITADLNSSVVITIDGFSVFEKTFNEPFLMVNEISSFYAFYNRSKDRESQDFEFGFDQLIMYGRFLEDYDRVKVYLIFSKRESGSIMYFNKNSYGTSPPGTSDISMVGNVESAVKDDKPGGPEPGT